jgi:hypothetical protein
MPDSELQRQTTRALIAEGLVAALTDAARNVSATIQGELHRPCWEQKTGKEGLEAAWTMLRGHLGPLVTGADAMRYTEVLRRAKALARAVEDLEGEQHGLQAGGQAPR